VRRFGWWSVVLGVAATLPILLLSWRSDSGAEASSQERTEILNEGLLLLRDHPILGVGVGQFANENPLSMTAHNSYLLIATEVGIPGYLLWCGLVWTTMKIPVSIAMRPPPGLDPGLARYAEALAASIIGLHIGVFFLSFVYKHIFFVWLGLAGALYGAVREHHPDYMVRTTWKDLVGICALGAVALVVVRLVALTAR
jgi:O-antigen ligase